MSLRSAARPPSFLPSGAWREEEEESEGGVRRGGQKEDEEEEDEKKVKGDGGGVKEEEEEEVVEECFSGTQSWRTVDWLRPGVLWMCSSGASL